MMTTLQVNVMQHPPLKSQKQSVGLKKKKKSTHVDIFKVQEV